MRAPSAWAAALAAGAALLLAAGPTSKSLHRGGEGAAQIALDLKRLDTVGAALYVAAHPDDENTALLSYLASERCVRTAYLSLTRGEGGQNLIGSEKGAYLGALRTEELLSARRIDGAEQYFTRAEDFGYSKNPEEALRLWGRDAVLEDVVRVIRELQPDVIVTRFPKNGDGGHGHHTASAILAEEAFEAAADPGRFPDPTGRVKPWRAKRLLWNAWRMGRDGPVAAEGGLRVDLGAFNPILGKSYTEIAGESRSQHKSQGFGAPERRGSRFDAFELVAGEPAREDLFEGVDLTWGRVPGGDRVAPHVATARRAFSIEDPSRIVPHLLEADAALASLEPSPRVDFKRRQVAELVRRASGIVVAATVPKPAASPGDSIVVSCSAIVRSSVPVSVRSVALPFPGVEESSGGRTLGVNRPEEWTVKIEVPVDAPPVGAPGWASPHTDGANGAGGTDTGDLRCHWVLAVGGKDLTFEGPLVHRFVDPVNGEVTRPFRIEPPLTLSFDAPVYLSREGSQAPVRCAVTVQNGAIASEGSLTLRVPEGFGAAPPVRPFALAPRASQRFEFALTPREGARSGKVEAVAQTARGAWSACRVTIDYPHVTPRVFFPPATARLVRADVRCEGRRAGFVEGSGDGTPQALAQLGFEVVPLTDLDLTDADLSRFDVLVTGVRAYNTRPVLATANARLLRYVEEGGTLVVQYNTTQGLVTRELGPFPFDLARDRVTFEDAPVAFTDAAHPLLTHPNRLEAADFAGWVQERGLYFASRWDPRYTTPLEMADPAEKPLRGSLLYARHGKGIYIYTSLALFRQLPDGVPGAYRLLANLVSARARD